MRCAVLIFFWSVLSHVASEEVKVECNKMYDPPTSSSSAPSVLADLDVREVTVGGNSMLNITWAINIDGSIASLNGTRIEISGETAYHCEYIPHLSKANLTGLDQKWFHFLLEATYGYNDIQVANVPLLPLGSGLSYKYIDIVILKPRVHTEAPDITTVTFSPEPPASGLAVQEIIIIVLGGLASLMMMSSCYMLCRIFRCDIGTLGFHRVDSGSAVPVLVVYPAADSTFQQAVVALAEFLQWHGGCTVAVDIWQQGKIAKLGPMRWLAEEAKTAERVVIVLPQPSSQPSHSSPHHGIPAPSVPAAAHDLYPLVLNMVGSHAKSATELSKFCVVQLAMPASKSACILPSELRVCKSFSLMKDLSKLCNRLHARKEKSKSTVDLMFKPRVSYSEKNTGKLREAVEKLRKCKITIDNFSKP